MAGGGDPLEVALHKAQVARDRTAPEERPPELLALLSSMEGLKVSKRQAGEEQEEEGGDN